MISAGPIDAARCPEIVMVDQMRGSPAGLSLEEIAGLQARETLYRSLVESVPDFILLLDLDG